MKKIIISLFYLLFSFNCVAEEKFLTMGTSAEYPPFEFRQKGKIVGFDIDVAKEIAKTLGYELKIVDMDFASLIPALQSGKIDFIMAGMSVTETRKKNVSFTETYYENSFSLITSEKKKINPNKDLAGKTIGVQLGSTMEQFAKHKAKATPSIKIKSLNKNSLLIEELKSGRLDGVVMEKIQAQAFIKMNHELAMVAMFDRHYSQTNGYAIAFPKNCELVSQFNKVLFSMKKNGSLQKVLDEWIGSTNE
jgi:ABC-type amino acid transport substrate-binding protein